MNKIIIIIIVFLFTNLWSQDSKYMGYWEWCNGPYGGCISDILVYEDILFCATTAGLYKKQGSNPWEFIGLGNLNIREITQNDNYIYAAGYYGCHRINKSTNEIHELKAGTVQAVAAIDSIVFLGLGNHPGIYRSLDFGETWEVSNSGINNFDIEKIFITDSKVILASASGASGSGIFRSTDLGLSWNRVDPYPYAWNFHGICQRENKIYGYDYNNSAKVYISEDDGLNWYSHNPPADQIYSIFINQTGLFVGTSRTGVFKSNDEGLSWSQINSGISNLDIFSLGGNDTILYAGSYGGIFSSIDFTSWENISSGLTNSQINSIIKVDNKMFAATHGTGIHFSVDVGESWQRIESNLKEDYVLDMLNIGNTMYIIASDNRTASFGGLIYKSTDGGKSWIKKSTGFDTGLLEKIVGNKKVILVGTGYGLFRSTNGANSWTKVLDGINYNMNVSDVAVIDSTAIVLNGTSYIYRSIDYGKNWESSQLPDLYYGNTVKDINNVYYIGSSSINRVFKSSDYGQTWSRVSGIPPGNNSVQTFAGYGEHIYAGLKGNGVLISTNSGNSWQTANINLNIKNVLSLYSNDSIVLAGTNGGGIFKFISAEVPIKFYSPTANLININSIFFNWEDHIAAEKYRFQFSDSYSFNNALIDTIINNTSLNIENLQYDKIYYYRISTVNEFWDDDFSSTYSIKIEFPVTIQLDQNYPNPFNSKTTIKYHVPERSNVELILFDITGKKITTLINELKDGGSHSYIYEISDLASGIYFYQIKNKNNIVTKKLVLIK